MTWLDRLIWLILLIQTRNRSGHRHSRQRPLVELLPAPGDADASIAELLGCQFSDTPSL